jgi:hypothetical protein
LILPSRFTVLGTQQFLARGFGFAWEDEAKHAPIEPGQKSLVVPVGNSDNVASEPHLYKSAWWPGISSLAVLPFVSCLQGEIFPFL